MSTSTEVADLPHLAAGSRVSVVGALRHLQLKRTVAGNDWAALTIAQGDLTVTALAFPRVFATIRTELLVPDAPVRVTGRVYRTMEGTTHVEASTVRKAAG